MAFAPNFFDGGGSGDATLANQQTILEELTNLNTKINNVGFTVLPAILANGSQIDISVFVGEVESPTIPITIEGLVSKVLEITWEPPIESNISLVANLEDIDIDRTENSISFTIPEAVRSTIRKLKYACREIIDTSDSGVEEKRVLFYGIWNTKSAALNRT